MLHYDVTGPSGIGPFKTTFHHLLSLPLKLLTEVGLSRNSCQTSKMSFRLDTHLEQHECRQHWFASLVIGAWKSRHTFAVANSSGHCKPIYQWQLCVGKMTSIGWVSSKPAFCSYDQTLLGRAVCRALVDTQIYIFFKTTARFKTTFLFFDN